MESHATVYVKVEMKVGIEVSTLETTDIEEHLCETALEKLHNMEMDDVFQHVVDWGYVPETAEVSTNPREHNLID